jgi:hypothetical protein
VTPSSALQEPTANAPLVRFASMPERAFAVADLTAAYPGATRQLHRGLAMLDRKRVLVQDDVSGLAPGLPLTWRMLTAAQVTVDYARSATLRQDGRTLRIEVLAPNSARLTARHAAPPTPVENQNKGITVIEASTAASDQERDVRIAVLLSPVGDRWAPMPAPEIVPLDHWR